MCVCSILCISTMYYTMYTYYILFHVGHEWVNIHYIVVMMTNYVVFLLVYIDIIGHCY